MSWVFAWGKRVFLPVLFSIIFLTFIFGFLIGNRYGESIPVLNQRLVPIYKVDRPDKKISLTLDGTWGAEYTEDLLKLFKEQDIKVTFFFAGYWLEKYPDLVKRIAADGHEIGNHTYTHPNCTTLHKEALIRELENTSDLIERLIGKRPRLFRPPFGAYNNQLINTSNELGYQVVQWSIDSLDWQEPGVNFIVERINNNVSAGDIILMHNNAPHTYKALQILIPELKKKGYQPVPLSQLIYQENYIIRSHDGMQLRQRRRNE